MSTARLERSTTNRVISGVCGGVAEYLAIDATAVRIFTVIVTVLTGGLFVIVYIAAIFLMPLPGRSATDFATTAGATAQDVAESLRKTADDIGRGFRGEHDPGTPPADVASTAPPPVDPEARARDSERRRMAFGYLLIALGVIFLLGNAGLFRLIQWQFVWPVALVAIGVFILVQRTRA